MTYVDDDKIRKVTELSAPIDKVWAALTNYKEFGQWFRVALDQPFEPGGISTGRMTYPGHEGVRWIAYIEQMDPKHLFSFRWYDSEGGAGQAIDDEPALLVEFELEEITGGTRLTITESGFSALPKARRIELMRSNEEGWNIQANNIETYVTD